MGSSRAGSADDFVKVRVGDTNLLDAFHARIGQPIVDGTVLAEQSVTLLRDGALDRIDIPIGANADELTPLDGKPDRTMPLEDFSSYMQKTYGDGYRFNALMSSADCLNVQVRAIGPNYFSLR